MSRKLNRKTVKHLEQATADKLSARRTFSSGSGMVKGDMRILGEWRIEQKDTRSSTYRLSGQDFWTIYMEATKAGEQPLYLVYFHTDTMGVIPIGITLIKQSRQIEKPIDLPKGVTLSPKKAPPEGGTRVSIWAKDNLTRAYRVMELLIELRIM